MTKNTSKSKNSLKGRGAQINPNGHFSKTFTDSADSFYKDTQGVRTKVIEVRAKSIVNHVPSPDIRMDYSMNPYQGCEHGCVYCYARNTHAYHDMGTGIEFESKIIAKMNTAELLRDYINRTSWNASPIMLSGNTDCYQPIERKYELTHCALKVFLEAKHPVGIITKNALILRDLPILRSLAELGLIQVVISITTANESLRAVMEPRTSTYHKKKQLITLLSEEGIPVSVMMAPIIPGLNDHEIMHIARETAQSGARSFHYATVRLNGDVETIFKDWIYQFYPDRAQKVLNGIAQLHGGNLNSVQHHERMTGKGVKADQIKQLVHLARKKYFKESKLPKLRQDLAIKNGQARLF